MRTARASTYDTYWVHEDVIELADQGDCDLCRRVMLNPDVFPLDAGMVEPLEYDAHYGTPIAHKRCVDDELALPSGYDPDADPMDLDYLGTATSALAERVELERLMP